MHLILDWSYSFQVFTSLSLKMLLLHCSKMLTQLEKVLAKKRLSQSLTVWGALCNINKGNPFHMEIVVDSWPDFSTVICRRIKKEGEHSNSKWLNGCSLFATDMDNLKKLLQKEDVLFWDRPFNLDGVPLPLYKVIRDAASCRNVTCELYPGVYDTLLIDDPSILPDMPEERIKSLSLTSLNTSHAELINSIWSFGGTDDVVVYLRELLDYFPGACILSSSGNPISWTLTNQFRAICMGYTLPQYRKMGYTTHTVLADKEFITYFT
ncbi:glycine N-acyltransferase-like protein 3 isoform X2 [Protopterus annectens]|uniref:glycine N-acyltransferase-like protein 3 isoform X2 n=1 Tax=Protopterus annectens TaxID=7888 RepID=UPI001CFB7504|nr:glycine N-acyltransferase-like protein 3 isoform X2 [Protopterus annectens]